VRTRGRDKILGVTRRFIYRGGEETKGPTALFIIPDAKPFRRREKKEEGKLALYLGKSYVLGGPKNLSEKHGLQKSAILQAEELTRWGGITQHSTIK